MTSLNWLYLKKTPTYVFHFLHEKTSHCCLWRYCKFRVDCASGSEIVQENARGAVSTPGGGWLSSVTLEEIIAEPRSFVNWLKTRVVLDSFFRADSTLTHMTIQVIQLRLNSNPKFANLTQLRLNSKPKFTNLTQLWLNSFESKLSQIWLTTHHILPNLGKSCWPGGGGCGRM